MGQRKWKEALNTIDDWEKGLENQTDSAASDLDQSPKATKRHHKMLAWAETSRAVCLLELEKLKDAETSANKALENQGITDSNRHRANSVIAVCLAHQKDFDAAEEKAVEAYESLNEKITDAPSNMLWYVPRAAERVIKVYELAEKPGESKKWQAKLTEVEQDLTENASEDSEQESPSLRIE